MEKERKTKSVAIVALIVAVLGLTVAFAALSQTLTINGSATINQSSWGVQFQNLGDVSKVGDAEVTTAPTLNGTSFSGLAVKFTKPGDSVSYTFDVKNTGSIDAKIGTFTKKSLSCTGGTDASIVCSDLEYTLTYTSGGAEVKQNDTLTAGQTKNLTLKVTYKDSATKLPSEAVTVSGLDITIVYEQD